MKIGEELPLVCLETEEMTTEGLGLKNKNKRKKGREKVGGQQGERKRGREKETNFMFDTRSPGTKTKWESIACWLKTYGCWW